MMNKNNPINIPHKTKPKKKAKKWTWSKPKDKPKRPLSAYNIFFKHTRLRIVEGLSEEATEEEVITSIKTILENSPVKKKRDRKSHGKISFGNLASAVSQKWKNTDDSRMAIFQYYAELDKKRYFSEIAIWESKKEAEALNVSSSTTSTITNDNDSTHSSSANLDTNFEAYPEEFEPKPLADLPISKVSTFDYQLQTNTSSSMNRIEIEEIKSFEDSFSANDIFDLKNSYNSNYSSFSLTNPLYEVVPISVEPSLHCMQELQRKRLKSGDFCPINEEIYMEDCSNMVMEIDLDPAPIDEINDSSKWFL